MSDEGGRGTQTGREDPDPNWARLRELLKRSPEPRALTFDSDGNLVVDDGSADTERGQPAERDALAELLATNEIVVLVGADRRILVGNEAAAQAIGTTVEGLRGRDLLEGIEPSTRDALSARFALGLGRPGATSQLVTVPVRRDDGTTVWLEGRATNYVTDPAIGGVLVRAHDVTADRRTVPVVDASTLLEAIFEHAPVGTLVLAPDSTIVTVNPALCGLVDRIAADLLGQLVTGIIYPDDVATFATLHQRAIQDGEGYAHEMRFVRPNGDEVWTLVAASPPVTASDRPYIINQVVDISEAKRIEGELAHAATHDSLTSLPNRAMLFDRLGQALARQQRHDGVVAVLFLDLDRLKPVNDKLGHAAGDSVLREAARRLVRAVRPTDTVARFGGDEFVVVCTDLTVSSDVDAVADRILRAFDEPVDADGIGVTMSVSVGLAVLYPNTAAGAEALLAAADEAMYRAKAAGRGRIERIDIPH